MFDQFSEDELKVASFRMLLENNAMLRILLANQIKIMEKFNMDIEMPLPSISDLIPGSLEDPQDYFTVFLQFVNTSTNLLQKRAWEWVQMNSRTDQDENDSGN